MLSCVVKDGRFFLCVFSRLYFLLSSDALDARLGLRQLSFRRRNGRRVAPLRPPAERGGGGGDGCAPPPPSSMDGCATGSDWSRQGLSTTVTCYVFVRWCVVATP